MPLSSRCRRPTAISAAAGFDARGCWIWSIPAATDCALPWIGRVPDHTAPATPPRRMQVLTLPLDARVYPIGGSPAKTSSTVAQARRWPSGSSARRCRSYSVTTARGRWCAEFLPRRNIPDECPSSAKVMGYVLLLIRLFTGSAQFR